MLDDALASDSSSAPSSEPADETRPDPTDPRWFVNRELSWVDFDRRVLELAQDERQRLLERVKFAAIFASNLDEFFMIRVAGLHAKVWLRTAAAARTAARRTRSSTRCGPRSSRW